MTAGSRVSSVCVQSRTKEIMQWSASNVKGSLISVIRTNCSSFQRTRSRMLFLSFRVSALPYCDKQLSITRSKKTWQSPECLNVSVFGKMVLFRLLEQQNNIFEKPFQPFRSFQKDDSKVSFSPFSQQPLNGMGCPLKNHW